MTDAETVRREMNRCGAARRPCLFGVDFELERGFFIEEPLRDRRILFAMGGVTNDTTAPAACPPPQLRILGSDAGEYARKFRTVREGLLRGDSFLLNLTERTPIETNLTGEEIFRNSRAAYRLLFPGRFVCFSPEPFVRIRGNEIASYPMKGTIDATLPDAERRLMESYKEQCEHYTITDLIRNDLNQVAREVRIRKFRYVEPIRTLRGEILQTSSEITGVLSPAWRDGMGDLLFRLLPAGSVSGAPKPSTLRIIRRAEGMPRGYYTGVFGYFDGSALDSAVMIRFIEWEEGQAYFRSGGGITVNSDETEEYREVLEKIYLSIP